MMQKEKFKPLHKTEKTEKESNSNPYKKLKKSPGNQRHLLFVSALIVIGRKLAYVCICLI